jgi:hypothetical protein
LKPPRPGDEDEGISRGAEVSDSIMSLDGLSETLEPEDEEIVLSDKELNDLAETGKALMAVAEELTRDQSGNNPGAESERAPQNVQAVVGADEPAPGGISPDDSSSATPDTDDLPDEVSIQSLTPDTDDLPGEASIQSLTVDGVVGEDRGAVSVVPKESDSESVTDGAAPQRTDEHSSSEVIPAETESRQTPVVSSGHRSVIWEKHDAGELLQAIRTSVPPPPDKRKVERARNRWRALAIASILLVMAMGGWTISGMSAAERDGWLEMFRGGGEGLRPGSVPDDGAIAPIRAKENIRVASGKTSPAATASVSLGGEAPKTTSSGEVVSVAGTAGEGAGMSKPQRAAEPQGSSTSSAAMESPRSDDETERKNDERKDRARDGESRSSSVPVRSDRPSARRDTTGELPSRPSEKAVRDAMAKVAPLVQNCGRESSGKMVVQMVVSGASGKVVASEIIDDTFRDTVAGRCAVRAIQRVQFPEFKRDRIIIRYPFAL